MQMAGNVTLNLQSDSGFLLSDSERQLLQGTVILNWHIKESLNFPGLHKGYYM